MRYLWQRNETSDSHVFTHSSLRCILRCQESANKPITHIPRACGSNFPTDRLRNYVYYNLNLYTYKRINASFCTVTLSYYEGQLTPNCYQVYECIPKTFLRIQDYSQWCEFRPVLVHVKTSEMIQTHNIRNTARFTPTTSNCYFVVFTAVTLKTTVQGDMTPSSLTYLRTFRLIYCLYPLGVQTSHCRKQTSLLNVKLVHLQRAVQNTSRSALLKHADSCNYTQ